MRQMFFPAILTALTASVAVGQDSPAATGPPATAATSQETAAADDASTSRREDSPLGELDWMVGTWVDKGEVATITTRCGWTKNGNFLTRSFKISEGDEVTLEGTQVVGWDPLEQEIRSWTFDSEGGFGEGVWARDGNRWLIKTSFVVATGQRASAVNVITYVDQNTLTWQSLNREVAGEIQPNIPTVTCTRVNSDNAPANAGAVESEGGDK